MRDEDWKTIIALHQYQNLTKAAASLYLTQPTMTKQLARIEQELGTSIVRRSNKGISFTPEGEFLVQQAHKINEIMLETRRGLWQMQGGLSGTLNIGTSSSFARSQLPRLLQDYSAQNAQTKFKVTVMLSSEALEAVQNEKIHVAFVNGDRKHHEKQVLCSCGAAYAIASRPIGKEDLLTMDMIMHNRDSYSRNMLESWWKQNFDQPMPIGIVVQDIDTSLKWVKDGLGYGVMFSNCLNEDEQFYRYPLLEPDGTPMRRNTWAICKKDWADYPLVANFMQFIEDRGVRTVD